MNLELVKELRSRTSLGLTACKEALIEASDDLDLAIEILQKRGLKKIDDLIIPLEGQVQASIFNETGENSPDRGLLIELNCQTDFGARSEVFQDVLKYFQNGLSVTDSTTKEKLEMLSKQLGEKVVLRRKQEMLMPSNSGSIVTYNHQGGNIAVLLPVFLSTDIKEDLRKKALDFGQEVAMHIAAAKPLGLKRESINLELLEKKKAFFVEEVKDKKPEFRERIVQGKLDKWFAEIVLLEQESVVHPKRTVKSLLDDLNKEITISLGNFIRFEKGEQI